jgi:hypothetical protein
MANTTFSGPVISNNGFTGAITGDVTGNITGGINATSAYVQVPSATAAEIADIDDAVNTANKVAGTIVLDTTNSRLMIALGADADSNWVAGDDSSTTVTPS